MAYGMMHCLQVSVKCVIFTLCLVKTTAEEDERLMYYVDYRLEYCSDSFIAGVDSGYVWGAWLGESQGGCLREDALDIDESGLLLNTPDQVLRLSQIGWCTVGSSDQMPWG